MKLLKGSLLKALFNVPKNIAYFADKFFDGIAYGAGATVGVFFVLKYVIVGVN